MGNFPSMGSKGGTVIGAHELNICHNTLPCCGGPWYNCCNGMPCCKGCIGSPSTNTRRVVRSGPRDASTLTVVVCQTPGTESTAGSASSHRTTRQLAVSGRTRDTEIQKTS